MKRIPDKQHFSKIGWENAYLQNSLSLDSKPLITINATWVSSISVFCLSTLTSSDMFQTMIFKVNQDLDGIPIHQVDVLSYGATRKKHDLQIKWVFTRLTQRTSSFKIAKCKFSVSHLEFLGFRISAIGYQFYPKRQEGPLGIDQAYLGFFMEFQQYYSRSILSFEV